MFVFALSLASCKTNDEPQYSPQFAMSEFVVSHLDATQKPDTLGAKVVDEVIVVDSISVGDTVRFAVLCNAVTNQLTSFVATTDTTILYMKVYLGEQHTKALDKSSVVEDCKLVFLPGYGAASFPMEYIARKSATANVTFTLSSTSEYSPTTLKFSQPIR